LSIILIKNIYVKKNTIFSAKFQYQKNDKKIKLIPTIQRTTCEQKVDNFYVKSYLLKLLITFSTYQQDINKLKPLSGQAETGFSTSSTPPTTTASTINIYIIFIYS